MKFFDKIKESLNKRNNYLSAVKIISQAELDVYKFVPEKNKEWEKNLNELFDALNTVSLYKPKTNLDENQRDEVLFLFFHEATLPNEVFGREIGFKTKEKISDLIYHSNEEQLKMWESLSNEIKVNDHGNVIELFKAVFSYAKAEREENYLSGVIGNTIIPQENKTKNRL